MIEQPLVSIIINCYNSEKFLRETVESVLAQTYTHYEVIFWDNCSIDKTAEIIKSYIDPRFKYYFAEKNTPLGEARNLAMKKVQGKYLCFLDSDDIWVKDFLKIGVCALEQNIKAVGFYCNYYNWKLDSLKEQNFGRVNGLHDYRYLLHNYGIGMSACIVKSDIIKSYDIKFDNTFSLVEDLDFFLKVSRNGLFIYDATPLYYYRITEWNTSHQNKINWAIEYSELYNALLNKDVKQEKIIEIKDLYRIYYFIVLHKLEFYLENNDRTGMLKYFLSHRIPLRFWSRLIFILFGKKMYLNIRYLL